jgi:hypothetical protein
VVVVGVGVPLLPVLAVDIRGAGRWLVAWLLVFGIAGSLGLLLLPWDLPG